MKLIDTILHEKVDALADAFNADKSRPFKMSERGIEEMLLKAKEKLIDQLLESFTEGEMTVMAFKTQGKKASKAFKENAPPPTPKDVEDAQGAHKATIKDVREFNEEWSKLPDPVKGRRADMTRALTAKFRTRMEDEFFRDNWKEAMEAMSTDPHCLGENGMNWVADKAYFLKPDTLERLLNRKDIRAAEHPKSDIPNAFR